ncbi:MAG: class I SAM-dependent methyltransferase [Armatimonadetes bacterium]|nr:class I SAM-dependent methyltransferase [Armatimonadota bacterium]
MLKNAERHFYKDRLFVRLITRYLRDGQTLEIGAGVGQLSRLLTDMGFDVIATDIQPWMVDYMRSIGLNAQIVDCLRIVETLNRQFVNILAQGPSPFITSNLNTVADAYRAVYAALDHGGRFIFILPVFRDLQQFSSMADHWTIIKKSGFVPVTWFRHQILPSPYYRHMPQSIHNLLERSLGSIFGTRHVVVLERP